MTISPWQSDNYFQCSPFPWHSSRPFSPNIQYLLWMIFMFPFPMTSKIALSNEIQHVPYSWHLSKQFFHDIQHNLFSITSNNVIFPKHSIWSCSISWFLLLRWYKIPGIFLVFSNVEITIVQVKIYILFNNRPVSNVRCTWFIDWPCENKDNQCGFPRNRAFIYQSNLFAFPKYMPTHIPVYCQSSGMILIRY